MKTNPALLFGFFVFLAASCSQEENEKKQEDLSGIRYEWIEESYEHSGCSTGEETCVNLTFLYPDFSGEEELADSLKRWVEKQMFYPEPDAPRTSGEELAKEWFTDYDFYAREIDDYQMAWTLERKIEVVYTSENLISLHFNEYSFTGGAHPSQVDLFRSFAIPEGEIVSLSDLTYDPSLLDRLKKLAEEQFRYTYELLENDDLEEAGYNFLDGEFNLPNNFAFTGFGLLFYFNSYEVAPYATGPITIELSYEDLESILRSRWLRPGNQVTLR